MYGKLASALFLAAGAAFAQPLPREAGWLAPGADAFAALAQSPGECLSEPETSDERYRVEAGRAAFRNPLLLGGQAARAGLSCHSCHVDGRDNPGFFIEGLSGSPGTADVTSSMFSTVRDDGAFNPVPIPSLVGAAGKSSFGTRAPASSMHAFIATAVTQEFQGAPPPDGVVDAIAAYIERLDENACPDGPQALTLARALDDVRRAVWAASRAEDRGDGAMANFLLLSAQQELSRIAERLTGPALDGARGDAHSLAREIGDIRADPRMTGRKERLAALEASVIAVGLVWPEEIKGSLFEPEALQAAIDSAP